MVKKSMNMSEDGPQMKKFELPSEDRHLFQVVDVYDSYSEMGEKMRLDANTVAVKLEVAEGDELGRTLIHRVSLDADWKGFFMTRLFLKAIGETYKGEISIDSDMWIGKQFVASVKHVVANKNGKTYANIDEFIFETTAEVGEEVVNPEDINFEG